MLVRYLLLILLLVGSLKYAFGLCNIESLKGNDGWETHAWEFAASVACIVLLALGWLMLRVQGHVVPICFWTVLIGAGALVLGGLGAIAATHEGIGFSSSAAFVFTSCSCWA